MSQNNTSPLISLKLDQDTILVFIDESGSPLLKGNQEAFCLGGCVVHSSQLAYLDNQWKLLMKKLFKNKNHIFHATSDVAKNLSSQQRQIIYDFFKKNNFRRLGTGYHAKSQISFKSDRGLYWYCVKYLLHKILPDLLLSYPILKPSGYYSKYPSVDIYLPFKMLSFRKIILIFEECQRDTNLVEATFKDSQFVELNGIKIPLEFCWMEKKYAHSGLQIADIISNSCYREILRNYKERKKDQGYDFKEIFHNTDRKYTFFRSISNIATPEAKILG